MDALDHIWEARAALKRAKREANLAWLRYQKQYTDQWPKGSEFEIRPDAARATTATHLPKDIKALLGIEG